MKYLGTKGDMWQPRYVHDTCKQPFLFEDFIVFIKNIKSHKLRLISKEDKEYFHPIIFMRTPLEHREITG